MRAVEKHLRDGTEPRQSDDFIEEIVAAVHSGYGFVPFLGAGFSASTGMPAVFRLNDYLRWCVALAAGLGHKVGDEDAPPWNPRTHRWPRLSQEREFRGEQWTRRALERAEKEGEGWSGQIYREAYAAMGDWKAALRFLARVETDSRPPRLGAGDRTVVDSFFREVLDGYHPGLAHRMLGLLSGPLRFEVLLTTNFDSLLERAFETARNPLQVFEVTPNAPLPTWPAISRQLALVKLHGGRLSLLADERLDAPMSAEESETYSSYLYAPSKRAGNGRLKSVAVRRHLLVVGTNANDARIWSWMEKNAESLGEDFRIFWLCYTEGDFTDIRDNLAGKPYRDRFRVLRHSNHDLLLLQLYQRLRRTLPPLGLTFPSSSRLNHPPLHHQAADPDDKVKLKERLDGESALLVLSSPRGREGVTQVAAEVYRDKQIGRGTSALWVDLSAVGSTDHLYEVLLEGLHYRLGIEDWIPSSIQPGLGSEDLESEGREIARLLKGTGLRWTLFLNARERPGENFAEEDEGPNGWLGARENWSRFKRFLEAISEGAPGTKSVVLVRGRSDGVPDIENEDAWPPHEYLSLEPEPNLTGNPADVLCERIREDEGRNKDEIRALVALATLQRPRHAAIVYDRILGLSSQRRTEPGELDGQRKGWIESWLKDGLLRHVDGGMLWMRSDCRTPIREAARAQMGRLALEIPGDASPTQDEEWLEHVDLGEIQRRAGEWYEKLLEASESPNSALEAAHHFLSGAREHMHVAELRARRQDPRAEPWVERRVHKAATLVQAAAALLRTNSYLIQTRGFPAGSRRRLGHLTRLKGDIDRRANAVEGLTEGSPPCEKRLRELRTAAEGFKTLALEVERAIFRECGLVHEALGVQNELSLAEPKEDPSARFWRETRWRMMLLTASRAYDEAEGLAYVDQVLGGRDRQETSRRDLDDQPRRIELLRIIEQAADVALLQVSARLRIGEEVRPGDLLLPESLVRRGRSLAQKVRDDDPSSDAHDTMAANWCETRLMLHRSAVEMFRRRIESTGPRMNVDLNANVERSLGLLADAEARLRISHPLRATSDLALIDLYRADAYLSAAGSRSLSAQSGGAVVSEILRGEKACEAIGEADRRYLTDAAGHAHRFIDRAGGVLRQRRRNVWWTTWYFERKLRAIAIDVLASIDAPDEPVPHVGAEVALGSTQAEEVLEDAMRMIPSDSYRLATIIDAYRCVLRMMSLRGNEFDHMDRMRRRLDAATEQLASLGGVEQQRGSPAVAAYVRRVSDEGDRSLRSS